MADENKGYPQEMRDKMDALIAANSPTLNINQLVETYGKDALVKKLLNGPEKVTVDGQILPKEEVITDYLDQYQEEQVFDNLRSKGVVDTNQQASVLRYLKTSDPADCNRYNERGEVVMLEADCYVGRGGTYPEFEESPLGEEFSPNDIIPRPEPKPVPPPEAGNEISFDPGTAVRNMASNAANKIRTV